MVNGAGVICLRSPRITEGAPAHSRPLGGRPVRRSRRVHASSIRSGFQRSSGELASRSGHRLVTPINSRPSPRFIATVAFRSVDGITRMLVSRGPSRRGTVHTTSAVRRGVRRAIVLSFLASGLDGRRGMGRLLDRYLSSANEPLTEQGPTSGGGRTFSVNGFI